MAEVSESLPVLLKVGWTALVALILYVYWREYGLENFLWFSDISLIGLCFALWLENPLLAGMMAVGTIALEAAWIADFIGCPSIEERDSTHAWNSGSAAAV